MRKIFKVFWSRILKFGRLCNYIFSTPLDTSYCGQSLYIVPKKGLRKKTELSRTLNRCACQQKDERQQKKPIYNTFFRPEGHKTKHNCLTPLWNEGSNHAHSTATSVHSNKLAVSTKHIWRKKHLRGKVQPYELSLP